MSIHFDEILKKAKGKVKGFGKTLDEEVKEQVTVIMQAVSKLQELYSHDTAHHLQIENIKCQKCNTASFKLHVRDPSNPKSVLKYSKQGWTSQAGKYRCPKCKKG